MFFPHGWWLWVSLWINNFSFEHCHEFTDHSLHSEHQFQGEVGHQKLMVDVPTVPTVLKTAESQLVDTRESMGEMMAMSSVPEEAEVQEKKVTMGQILLEDF